MAVHLVASGGQILPSQIEQRVQSYLAFVKGREQMDYGLLDEGVFQIFGAKSGFKAFPPRRDLGCYRGRFIDIVGIAANINVFYYQRTYTPVHNPLSGYIARINIKDVPQNLELEGVIARNS